MLNICFNDTSFSIVWEKIPLQNSIDKIYNLCVLLLLLTCNVSSISSFSKIESNVCIWSHDARACKYDEARRKAPKMKDDATTVKPMIFAIRTELVSRLYACFSDVDYCWAPEQHNNSTWNEKQKKYNYFVSYTKTNGNTVCSEHTN